MAIGFVGGSLSPARAGASLGPLTTSRIATDSVRGDTPTTWNAHLPKMATHDGWEYFVYTRTSSTEPVFGMRTAWIFKRRVDSVNWAYANRVFNYFVNVPGLVIDTSGRLHVVFTCAADSTCTSGGAHGYGVTTARFYDLIFTKTNANGSFKLGPDTYENYDEWPYESCGYLGVGTDPATGETFGSLSFPDATNNCNLGNPNITHSQWVFNLRTGSPTWLLPPKVDPSTWNLYPQIAISPSGTRYYVAGEWVPGGNSARYGSFALTRWTGSGFDQPAFTDSVSDPNGDDRWVFPSDMSYGPNGELYFLYVKYAGAQGCNSYLIKETSAGSGIFSSPTALGCRGSYAQLQVDSLGRVYILQDNDGAHVPKLLVSVSTDEGSTFGVPQEFPVPKSADGLPAASTDITQPTLVKPWSTPETYDRDALHGFVANYAHGPDCTTNSRCTWSAVEFTIPIED